MQLQTTLQHTPEEASAAARGHYVLETTYAIVCVLFQGSTDFTVEGSAGEECGEEL